MLRLHVDFLGRARRQAHAAFSLLPLADPLGELRAGDGALAAAVRSRSYPVLHGFLAATTGLATPARYFRQSPRPAAQLDSGREPPRLSAHGHSGCASDPVRRRPSAWQSGRRHARGLVGAFAAPLLRGRSWQRILGALREELPEAVFCFVGKLERDERTSTSWTREQFESLGNGIWVVDEPLLDQLALVEACDLFLSPHTGFGCAAVSVGTPWLTLSGGPWHEWFFNGVPFHSVLPDTSRYPAFTQMGDQPDTVDDEGEPRTPSMTRARVEDDLPELVEAARALVEKRMSYEQSLRAYFPRLLEVYDGDRSKIFSFDGIHRRFIVTRPIIRGS